MINEWLNECNGIQVANILHEIIHRQVTTNHEKMNNAHKIRAEFDSYSDNKQEDPALDLKSIQKMLAKYLDDFETDRLLMKMKNPNMPQSYTFVEIMMELRKVLDDDLKDCINWGFKIIDKSSGTQKLSKNILIKALV